MNEPQQIIPKVLPWGMDEDGEFLITLKYGIPVIIKRPAEFIELKVVLKSQDEEELKP